LKGSKKILKNPTILNNNSNNNNLNSKSGIRYNTKGGGADYLKSRLNK